jgi:glycosyltransferase involved in cell wall biosynthesis
VRKKRIFISVINDLATDQRVRKICWTLYENGYDIVLVGRKLKHSLPVENRPYKVIRMKLLFIKGPAFYALFNIRLFFLLLFSRADILHANDLDTLPANYLVSLLKRKPLVYDTHELFTEVPELTSRPKVQAVWNRIEKSIFPKLKYVLTVNDSIAEIYHQMYGSKVKVVRNLPNRKNTIAKLALSDFGLDSGKKMIILQGAGINIDRGAEELVEAMKLIDGALLVIAGDGDIVPYLKEYVIKENLQDKVVFFSKMPYERLIQLTVLAHCGVTLDKGTNLNYLYSLPNKLFDYIMAGIPVVASDLPEVKKIVSGYRIGLMVDSHEPEHIAMKLKEILFDIPQDTWAEGLVKASEELCWENEQYKLMEVYEQIG